jgi:hypothetical protein
VLLDAGAGTGPRSLTIGEAMRETLTAGDIERLTDHVRTIK